MVWRVCGGGDWFVDAIAIKEQSTLYKVSRFLSALIMTHVSVSTAL